MAVKNKRVRLYKLAETGTAGRPDQGYAIEPGELSDNGFWAAISYVSGTDKTVGAQAEHTVLYDVTLSTTVPLENADDAYLVVLPDEMPILKVLSVGKLYNTGEKQARCIDVSDAAVTLTG